MKKGKIILPLSLSLFLFCSSTVYAAESPITKTEVFQTESSEFKYDFQDEIEENGSKYKLGKVEYSILSQKPVTQKVHKTTTSTFDNLYEKQFDISDPSTTLGIVKIKQITVDGKIYDAELESIDYEGMTITNRTAPVETTVNLTEDEITDTIEYDYDDVLGKQTVKVTLTKASVEETDETEESSIVFPVVFHNYDADEFLINNKLIKLSDGASPVSSEYYPDIKAESLHADDPGEITDMVWTSEPYIADGELCRNASATLTESRKIYAVKYMDEVRLPDTEGYRAVLTYGTDADEKTERTTYEVQAKAEYLPIEEQNMQPLFIGIGVAVFALLFVIILVIIAKKKKNKPKPAV